MRPNFATQSIKISFNRRILQASEYLKREGVKNYFLKV